MAELVLKTGEDYAIDRSHATLAYMYYVLYTYNNRCMIESNEGARRYGGVATEG